MHGIVLQSMDCWRLKELCDGRVEAPEVASKRPPLETNQKDDRRASSELTSSILEV